VDRPLDLNEIAIFSCVAEEESLTRAARRLGLPKSTVSRKITALEDHLRARLLHRTPRRVQLTDVGRALHLEARTALAQLGDAAERVTEHGDALRGRVRISAPNDFGVTVLSGVLCEFARRYPEIALEIDFTDRAVDLTQEGFDFAVRVGPLLDPSLVARQVGAIRGHLVASPAYAKRHALPTTPQELSAHPYIEFCATPPYHGIVRLHGPAASMIDVPVNATLRANSLVLVRDAVLSGLGIGRLPTYLGGQLVTSGHLVHVLPEHWTGERPIYLVHTGRRLLPARVTLVLDFLATHIASA